MKFITRISTAISLSISLLSSQALALKVDKMVLVADEKGNGIITLINDEDKPIFVLSEIEELTISNGDNITKNKYVRDNLSDWKISLTHQKLILAPGEEKDIGIRSLCHSTTCDDSRDLMFRLPFIPSKYQAEGEASGVEVNYGFAPIYIIPTTKPSYSYNIINNGTSLTIENKSNTLLNVFVDACDSDNSNQCKQKLTLIAGRDKTFLLPETMQNDELNITVSSHDRSYSKSEVVLRGEN
ncbi:hypothetical protein ERW51_08575 [Aliivibrio finisterrensis]|uniref:hypothetical protein n=1 Tax=Aliivibrio finisterrensis TaxID=511998 RepID=UPI00101F00A5|nr:hypothetical protein [Aliivibrio finisterrensis]RYU68413.1 hypothetical protein ERW54_08770 [Aliivibrio finisterrensis]RYU72165.1 hypothetical protein ERW51_08575 [Aliivibrio finisterrensis]RYU75681.1 hypothetical protein ERW48_07520 [Aliivibrio finisterrensis]